MGLLQEGLLAGRIPPSVRRGLRTAQSGFVRGTEDPQLVIHEISAAALPQGLCIWMFLGDFIKAFPKTWRGLLVVLLAERGGVAGGCMASLCSVMEHDDITIWLSGRSVV